MNSLPFILQIVSGVAFGNISGAAFSGLSLGGIGNSLAGFIGGGLVGQAIQSTWGNGFCASDLQIFVSSVMGGALGGATLMLMAGLINGIVRRKT